MGIHFIHEKGKGPAPLPLVITHGWPSTVFEMSKIIPMLTDPAAYGGDPQDAFDVVAPSLPGYGFSDITGTRGINVARIADLWSQLMTTSLGYSRYGAHGGDWGAGVTARLGFSYGSQVIGIHTTSVSGVPTGWQPAQLERLRRGRGTVFQQGRTADDDYDLLGHADDQLLHPHLLREPAQSMDHPARAGHRRAMRRSAVFQGNQPAAA